MSWRFFLYLYNISSYFLFGTIFFLLFFVSFFGLFDWLVAACPVTTATTTPPSLLASCFWSVRRENDMFEGIENKKEESGNIPNR